MRHAIHLICVAVFPLLAGCVERQMVITSEPSNALVYLNGEEVGRTPIERDFTWYGTYDVRVRSEGYQTLKTEAPVIAPWWQWPPFDLVAEFMWWHPTDRQELHFTLEKQDNSDASAQSLLGRAVEMRSELGDPQR